MMPYRIRSASVSERFNRGTSAGGLAVEVIHRLTSQNKTPLSCGDNGVRGKVSRGLQDGKWGRPAAVPQNPLEFYTEGIFCQRKKLSIKTILANFLSNSGSRRNPVEFSGNRQEHGHNYETKNKLSDSLAANHCGGTPSLRASCAAPGCATKTYSRENCSREAGLSGQRSASGNPRRRPRHEPFR